ncbi:LOW QUALITY PROTEIN: pickpocket protein 11 [Drosophila albomicans]|uniref:LOW QUALITY PROTEIN: pickpocket protein 11 n=1 Tax=Drosophila albomicans TaxID=7291 RepID=A0A6P8WM83_DROAB|nr:LOW QUALITY PROTEIN: pickpocket protein 11 [Drosophila albomicans]
MSKEELEQPIYLINFEEYLRPKQPHKSTALQCFDKPIKPESQFFKIYKRLKFVRWLRESRSKLSKKLEQVPLPRFLNFLRERNDDGLCKPKTGFEIYCEMSSIHGFHLFVGAKTWQRVLWWIFICIAVVLSLLVLIMSYGRSAETPTIRYIESIMQPSGERSIPFPALTICDSNRISKRSLFSKAREWDVTSKLLQKLPWLPKRNLGQVNESMINTLSWLNFTWSEVLEQLSPQLCETQLLTCLWQGETQSCKDLFATTWSYSEGRCCSFMGQPKCSLTSCQSAKGLTIRLATKLEDYGSSSAVTAGFHFFIHEAGTTVDATHNASFYQKQQSHLMLKPYETHASSYIASLPIEQRRCYLPNERKMFQFSIYSQDNCVAECRSARIFEKCGCVPPYMPSRWYWSQCPVGQYKCVQDQDLSWDELQSHCNCLPPCQFYRYDVHSDVTNLDASQSMTNVNNDGFFQNFNASDELVVHIYFDSLSAEQLRLDVYENWLTFIGTFGGITGLFMGCSFVSVFELVFFVCVRPTCNWLLRQRVRYRLRRRRRQIEQAANGN